MIFPTPCPVVVFVAFRIAELVWALESYYLMGADQVVELVEAVLSTPGLEVQDAPLIRAALVTYLTDKVDFIDAWIMEFARSRKVDRVYTFDKRHFKEIGSFHFAAHKECPFCARIE
ncbi:MAG: PIN domain-containing protein [Deltaproteobacteria bacterium]